MPAPPEYEDALTGRPVGARAFWEEKTSARKKALCSYLLLVVRPGAPSSVLAPSSDPRSP